MINITSWTELDAIRNDLTEDYQLTRSLLTSDADYIGIGDNWSPIINWASIFDGNGYIINGLVIGTLETEDDLGLFYNITTTGVVRFVQLVAVNIWTSAQAGAITAKNEGTIEYCSANGTVHGGENVGGLVGWCKEPGIISNSCSEVDVDGAMWVGGLVGLLSGDGHEIGNESVNNSYAIGTVNVSATGGGGFVGKADDSQIITNCYATGILSGNGVSYGFGKNADLAQFINCGWFRNPTGATEATNDNELITYNIKDGGGEGYIDDTIDWFYDKTRGIYTISPVWDFTTPIWYEYANDFPKLEAEEESAPEELQKGTLPIFKRI